MGEIKQFRLPDVGEGLVEAEILSWLVKPGDEVKVNQNLIEIETAKAAVELPSPFAGVVTELLVTEGSTVEVGTPIISIDVGGDAPGTPTASATPAGAGAAESKREPVLVGYGVKQSAATRRPRKQANGTTAAPEPEVLEPEVPEPSHRQARPEPEPVSARETPAAPAATPVRTAAQARPLAKPPVRKLAKDLGVDLSVVVPTGDGGVITRDDVQQAAAGPVAARSAAPRRAVGGVDVRIPIRGVRKATATAVTASAFTAPHVTEFLTIDITRTMRLVTKLRALPEFADVRVSPLLLVAKALLVAIRRNPEINARWDEVAGEIVRFGSVNLGIAAATPRGLIVPNIKGADALTLPELAGELAQLTQLAREGRTPLADMTGGTVTITNVGVFGVDTGTPILNSGEAAILAFGAVREQPWVHKGKVKPRQVTTLGLSFDHRLVDGELGSKVLRDIGQVLTDPSTALAWS